MVADIILLIVSKAFVTMCPNLWIKQKTASAYHPQTDEQVERYDAKIVSQLRHFIADQQQDWGAFVQLTFVYDT